MLVGRAGSVSGQRPGRGRLSRSAEFDRVFRHGRSHAGRDLVLYVFPRAAEAQDRGSSAARPVGVAQGGRRRRAQPGQAPAARGVRRREQPPARRHRRRASWRGAERASWPSARAWPGSARRCASCWPRSRASQTPRMTPPCSRRLQTETRRPPPSPGMPDAPPQPHRAADPRSTSGCSRRPSASAASTTRRALSTRCRRSSDTAYSAGLSWPGGGCFAATPGVTAGFDPVSRTSGCSSLGLP